MTSKITLRSTVIKVKDAEGENRIIEAICKLGIDCQEEKAETEYYDGDIQVYQSIVEALKRHGIECRTAYNYYTQIKYSTGDDIKAKFGIGKDVNDLYISVEKYSISIKSYNIGKRKHISEVRKLYRRIKKLGYIVSHDCDCEISSTKSITCNNS